VAGLVEAGAKGLFAGCEAWGGMGTGRLVVRERVRGAGWVAKAHVPRVTDSYHIAMRIGANYSNVHAFSACISFRAGFGAYSWDGVCVPANQETAQAR
jgi:hypothetical protein